MNTLTKEEKLTLLQLLNAKIRIVEKGKVVHKGIGSATYNRHKALSVLREKIKHELNY